MNVDKKEVVLSNGRRVRYEKVLIATGGHAKTLADIGVEVPEAAKSHITTFRTVNDYQKLSAMAREGKSITILGGGLLGSELVCALSHVGTFRPVAGRYSQRANREGGGDEKGWHDPKRPPLTALGTDGAGVVGACLFVAGTSTASRVHQVFIEAGVLGMYLPNYLSSYTTMKLQQRT